MSPTLYLLLADLLLYLHFAVVAFLVGGFVVIWIGRWRGWGFVQRFGFRVTHLLTLAFVTAQALAGRLCPLTIWENALRERAGAGARYPGSFIAHWMERVLYHDVDPRWLACVYVLFFAAVLATWWLAPVQPPAAWRRSKSK